MKKTLVPLTDAQMRLIVDCLEYCASHPSLRDIEIVDVKEKVLFYALKDKCFEATKVFPNGNKKQSSPKIETKGSTDSELLKSLEKSSKVGKRTENKLNIKKPPFGFS
jgi:hypothetical protein